MTGILFPDADDCDAIGTTFRRQVEIDNFRKLLLQDRDKDLVKTSLSASPSTEGSSGGLPV
jgi:hypothetical protein